MATEKEHSFVLIAFLATTVPRRRVLAAWLAGRWQHTAGTRSRQASKPGSSARPVDLGRTEPHAARRNPCDRSVRLPVSPLPPSATVRSGLFTFLCGSTTHSRFAKLEINSEAWVDGSQMGFSKTHSTKKYNFQEL